MKRMIKRILFTFSILFLPALLIIVFCLYVELRYRQEFTYISKNTPLGSSRDDVRAFVREKGYKIRYDSNSPHRIHYNGITLPITDYLDGIPYKSNERIIGVSNIEVVSFKIEDIVCFMCAWAFDEDDKLILINLFQEWNWL